MTVLIIHDVLQYLRGSQNFQAKNPLIFTNTTTLCFKQQRQKGKKLELFRKFLLNLKTKKIHTNCIQY